MEGSKLEEENHDENGALFGVLDASHVGPNNLFFPGYDITDDEDDSDGSTGHIYDGFFGVMDDYFGGGYYEEGFDDEYDSEEDGCVVA